MADLDRLVQTLYASAFEDEWQAFRLKALAAVCKWLGASSGAWLTRSTADLPGEFTAFPPNTGLMRRHLAELNFDPNDRERLLDSLPAEWQRPGFPREQGILLNYAHRGGGLASIILLRVPTTRKQDLADLRRGIGHMVEAGSLALRQFIQRDEWLFSLGRPSRGTAALVDAKGTLYAASPRFREMVAEDFGTQDFFELPEPLPEAALEEADSAFFIGKLHFRAKRQGNLYLLHARAPMPMDGLSAREQQIARALASGKTFKSVAKQYDIAISTVANHASRIYKKLGIFRREELMDLARKPAPTA